MGMRFGQATAARPAASHLSLARSQAAPTTVGRGAPGHAPGQAPPLVSRAHMLGYTPKAGAPLPGRPRTSVGLDAQPSTQGRTQVGLDTTLGAGCERQAEEDAQYGMQPWCYSPQQWRPIPLGPNAVVNTIPAAVAGVPGVGTLTFAVTEAVVVYGVEITDPTGSLVITGMTSGRYPIPEGGNFSANSLQSASTGYKFCRGVPIYPSSPLIITFANPTGAAINVTGKLDVIVLPCRLQIPTSLQNMLAA
jgi:hypothetical protein